ncbi:MAG: ASCH domain-containing protein [Aridibacter sp.]
MKNSEQIEEFWREFCEVSGVDFETPYEFWYFHYHSEGAKRLADLVVSGKKKATTDLAEWNEAEDAEGAIVGGYNVITDFDGNPQCVVQMTEIRVMPFSEVDAQFAFDEGEGDQTLEYWRNAHRKYFTESLELGFDSFESGVEFDESTPVACKRFKLLFPTK